MRINNVPKTDLRLQLVRQGNRQIYPKSYYKLQKHIDLTKLGELLVVVSIFAEVATSDLWILSEVPGPPYNFHAHEPFTGLEFYYVPKLLMIPLFPNLKF